MIIGALYLSTNVDRNFTGISLAVSFIMPIPFSLPIIIEFLSYSFYMRKGDERKWVCQEPPYLVNSSSISYYCVSCGQSTIKQPVKVWFEDEKGWL
jgi:hypothetical protein